MFETAFVLFRLGGIKRPTEETFFFSLSSNIIVQEKKKRHKYFARFDKPRMYN